MTKYILVLNCGSSSIKFSVIDINTKQKFLSDLCERIASPQTHCIVKKQGHKNKDYALPQSDYEETLNFIFKQLTETYNIMDSVIAIGHRVVHGGDKFTQSTLIDDKSLQTIKECAPLAPLHNQANIIGIELTRKKYPALPQVAVFDTAFHQTMPERAYLYAVPYELYTKHGVRRYGFHGTSHKYVSQKAAEILNNDYTKCSFLTAHLGNGCSATAIVNGQSQDTTMGLTPLEGLIMGTRSGDVDPGLHQFLANTLSISLDEITTMLNKKSGLLGIAERFSDMRSIEQAAKEGDKKASLAIEMFCYRTAQKLAALSVAIPEKIDALIFTGGIGENSSLVRSKILHLLHRFGFELDENQNSQNGKESNGRITRSDSTLALVIPTNEELMIALETLSRCTT